MNSQKQNSHKGIGKECQDKGTILCIYLELHDETLHIILISAIIEILSRTLRPVLFS